MSQAHGEELHIHVKTRGCKIWHLLELFQLVTNWGWIIHYNKSVKVMKCVWLLFAQISELRHCRGERESQASAPRAEACYQLHRAREDHRERARAVVTEATLLHNLHVMFSVSYSLRRTSVSVLPTNDDVMFFIVLMA